MNIQVITNMYPSSRRPHYGKFVENSVTNLKRMGICVDVIFPRDYMGKLISYIMFYLQSFWLSLTKSQAIIYVHYISHSAPPVLLAALFRRNIKFVLHAHGSDVFPEVGESGIRVAIKGFIVRKALRKASALIVPSEYFRQKIIESYGDVGNIFTSPSGGVDVGSGVDVKRGNQTRLLYASRLIPGKGGVEAAKAIGAALRSNPQLTASIVGEGPEKAKILDALATAGVEERVIFHPMLKQDCLFAEMAKSDIFIFASTRKGESLGLVLVEAAICGCVPVVINNGAVGEVMPERYHGMLIAHSFADLTEKVQQVSGESRATLAKINSDIREYCLARYDAAAVARNLIVFLENLDHA